MDAPIKVVFVTRTGQTVDFVADEMKRSGMRYEFTTYPELRGYKKITIVEVDAVSTISIEAPVGLFSTLESPSVHPAAALGAVGLPLAPDGATPVDFVTMRRKEPLNTAYRDADPQHSGPRAIPLTSPHGSPVSAVKISGQDVVVQAGMLAGMPKL